MNGCTNYELIKNLSVHEMSNFLMVITCGYLLDKKIVNLEKWLMSNSENLKEDIIEN